MPGKLNDSLVKLLVERAENEGIAAKAVAQRSGLSESTISRTFAGNRVMNVNEFEQIALAIGLVPWRVMREAERPHLSIVSEQPTTFDPAAYGLALQEDYSNEEADQ